MTGQKADEAAASQAVADLLDSAPPLSPEQRDHIAAALTPAAIEVWAERQAADAPPLTHAQRDRLALLFHPHETGQGSGFRPLSGLDQTPPPVKKCALYRHFDQDDVLLYVGVSVTPDLRRRSHARHSAFMEFSVRQTIEWFNTDKQAREAEREAIKSEHPLFNKVHADDARDAHLVEYLVERGAFHLLRVG